MITINVVYRGEVLSGTDRSRSAAVGRYLTAAGFQQRLFAVHREMRRHPQFGAGAAATINGVPYRAVFESDWMVEVEAQVVLGRRVKNQLPDLDNVWRDFQNALAFPPEYLRVPPPKRGRPLYTVVANDRQFTRYSVSVVPDPMAERSQDLIIAQFTAKPPPALALALAQ
jgi:hypothetical protein